MVGDECPDHQACNGSRCAPPATAHGAYEPAGGTWWFGELCPFERGVGVLVTGVVLLTALSWPS
ncbi:hypothetical protein GCM10009654_46410 [Streptomyces hebeiensis]|uniref:Uncharacterized protein n=1 Tax=Streptomyces hebeiensis TaxID=229486 RepID=A0ABP4FN26_9ACTN